MFGKTQLIKFAATEDYLETPTPSKLHVPDWYKKSPRFLDGSNAPAITTEDYGNLGIKTCIPFIDGLTSGYTAVLWQDIVVTQRGGFPDITWNIKPDVMKSRSYEGLENFPVPEGHNISPFVWKSPFIVQTPPGYSVIISHPVNRFDLPFTTLSAVVDSDKVLTAGHYPFYMKEGFEGVIKAGTPIYQIMPFKRDNWDSEVDNSLREANGKRTYDTLSRLMGYYKNNVWAKKKFN